MAQTSEKTVKTARIFVMGKKYEVPEGLTIMKALEYSGYRHVRGVGCRAGFCGACSTIYRMEGDHRLRGALACQSTVVDGMHIVQIPFVPANKAIYSIEGLSKDELGAILLANYPEMARCLSCNTCTKACPQKIEVMDYIQASLRGDVASAATISFDCIQCGLCAVRCPAEIAHYHVAQLARRLYGKYILPKSAHLETRAKEVEAGKFANDLTRLSKSSLEELKKLYVARDIEKGE